MWQQVHLLVSVAPNRSSRVLSDTSLPSFAFPTFYIDIIIVVFQIVVFQIALEEDFITDTLASCTLLPLNNQ
ncbi:hypothetical protein BDU57DRAFT_515103 [Ampelomyces quisqualis]|uniref:Uncharacterized protein n=1 Tax=Ampelomyces quisqualis TaxID=50730 RepID=A0A6A5QUZ5_AMPQU|nr:hypothetical protein BDU57DRAFT_515103 [Ampelomyces quisqualis]